MNLSKEEFEINNKKVNELKESIEKEILKINNLYDKVNNEVTSYYQKQYEILVKEENELKEKLQNEVTKIKEKLEIFLSECINSIKINEKLNKGIEKMLKEKESRIIKKLSYVSKINKTKKIMNTLILQLMKNINIKFKEEKKNIEYEDYYFNGIPRPSDIDIIDITDNGFNLKWKISTSDFLDKNKIKFRVDIKKKDDKNYEKTYEGADTNCKIDNLKEKTDYEFKLCTLYNNSFNNWSEIYNVRTKESQIIFDNESLIINKNSEYITLLKNWILNKNNDNNKSIKAELLYRLSRDGNSYQSFHNNCDNKGPTLTFIYDENENKMGGYTPLDWDSHSRWKRDNDTFLFSLTKKKQFKKPNNINSESIYCLNTYGPWFNNFGFENNYNMNTCKFQYGNEFLNANEIIENERKSKYFKTKEVEVYKISIN